MPKVTMPIVNPPKYEIRQNEYIEVLNTEGRYVKAHRIYALRDFRTIDGVQVRTGDEGGFVQHELNLSQSDRDRSWISPLGVVIGTARVTGDAHYVGGALLSEGIIFKSPMAYGEWWGPGGSPLLIKAKAPQEYYQDGTPVPLDPQQTPRLLQARFMRPGF